MLICRERLPCPRKTRHCLCCYPSGRLVFSLLSWAMASDKASKASLGHNTWTAPCGPPGLFEEAARCQSGKQAWLDKQRRRAESTSWPASCNAWQRRRGRPRLSSFRRAYTQRTERCDAFLILPARVNERKQMKWPVTRQEARRTSTTSPCSNSHWWMMNLGNTSIKNNAMILNLFNLPKHWTALESP